MCSQMSNNVHATCNHLTLLNVEFEDLIATCNTLYENLKEFVKAYLLTFHVLCHTILFGDVIDYT